MTKRDSFSFRGLIEDDFPELGKKKKKYSSNGHLIVKQNKHLHGGKIQSSLCSDFKTSPPPPLLFLGGEGRVCFLFLGLSYIVGNN